MRDVGGGKASNQSLCDGGMQQKLMGREGDVALRGVDNLLCALLDGGLELRSSLLVRGQEGIVSERPREEALWVSVQGGCCSDTGTYERDDFARLVIQAVGELLVVGDEMGDVNVAIVPLGQDVLSYLVSVDECILEVKVEDKVDQLLLHLGTRVVGDRVSVFREHTQGVD